MIPEHQLLLAYALIVFLLSILIGIFSERRDGGVYFMAFFWPLTVMGVMAILAVFLVASPCLLGSLIGESIRKKRA